MMSLRKPAARHWTTLWAAALVSTLGVVPHSSARAGDYPTVALADYVFGCMATNGQTREALERCSCSIDVIASLIPYEEYVKAETILRMRLVSGEKSVIFKENRQFRDTVDRLKGAQAESEIRCF